MIPRMSSTECGFGLIQTIVRIDGIDVVLNNGSGLGTSFSEPQMHWPKSTMPATVCYAFLVPLVLRGVVVLVLY